jgi:hypothetical protein
MNNNLPRYDFTELRRLREEKIAAAKKIGLNKKPIKKKRK